MDKVSIIVPVYNVERYLKRCVDSIINQTYKKIEVILIDDGSKDKSGIICDQMAKIDKRVKVIHTKNQGVSQARNEGLKIATGDYIYLADADDWLEPLMLEKMIKCQNDLKVDLVICGYYVEEKNKSISYCMEKNQMLDNVTLMEKVYVPAEINGVVWNKLFSRRLLYNEDGTLKILFCSSYSMWEDVLWVTEVCIHVKKAYYMAEPQYHYIKRDSSASTKGFRPYKVSMIAAGMKIRDILNKNEADREIIKKLDNYMHLHFRGTIYEIYKFSPQYKEYITYFRSACFQIMKFGLLNRNSRIHNILMRIHPRLDSIFITILQKSRNNTLRKKRVE